MDKLTVVTVDQTKVQQLKSFCWCHLERPLVAVPCEFNLKDVKKMKSGYLMFTRGSIYLFKYKLLTKSLKKPVLHHLLDAQMMRILKKEIQIEFDEFNLRIKTEQAPQIAAIMIHVLKSCTYGLTSLQTMNFEFQQDVTVPEIVIKERPAEALKWRALFLAHFYGITGMQLYSLDYFKKYESKLTPLLLIGPSLHPGNFAAAFGHAIAWESLIRTICFQSFGPTKFPMFFDSLVDNAQTIKKLVFTDYTFPKRILNFTYQKLIHTSIMFYTFIRVLPKALINFIRETNFLPICEALTISKVIKMTDKEFNEMADYAESSESLIGTLKYFEFARTPIYRLPIERFTSMFNAFEKLESIAIRYINGEGDEFIRCIVNSRAPIKAIHVNFQTFTKDMSDIVFPKTLVLLDVSYNKFEDESLLSLLKNLSATKRKRPIILQCIKIKINPTFYEKMGSISLSNVQPVLSEFDWSGNYIPSKDSQNMFAFLFTQKCLRLVTFIQIEAEVPVEFLKNLLTLISNIQLPGFEVSGNFDTVTLSQFIQAITQMNLTFLRHIGFRNNKAGPQALGAFDQLLKLNPNIVEIVADGFSPDNASLQAFWSNVVAQKNIIASDMPTEDMKFLEITPDKIKGSFKDVFNALKKKKKRTATPGKRAELIFKKINNGKKIDQSGSIFIKASKWVNERSDNDFSILEFFSKKLETNDPEVMNMCAIADVIEDENKEADNEEEEEEEEEDIENIEHNIQQNQQNQNQQNQNLQNQQNQNQQNQNQQNQNQQNQNQQNQQNQNQGLYQNNNNQVDDLLDFGF